MIVIVVIVVTGGKQSQLLASALGLGLSLTTKRKTFSVFFKNYLRATKRIMYDMGNFLDANRPCYGLSLFYF